MFFKENSPAVIRCSVSDMRELMGLLKAYEDQPYIFYLSKKLAMGLFEMAEDYVQLTSFTSGEKELKIKHGSIFEYKLYCIYGYSKIYNADVYRVETIEKNTLGDNEKTLKYNSREKGCGYVLFDMT